MRTEAPSTVDTTTNSPVWTGDAVRALGLTTDVTTAAAILGIGRTTAYALARAGRFPVPVLRVGRRYRVPTQGILRLLDASATATADSHSASCSE